MFFVLCLKCFKNMLVLISKKKKKKNSKYFFQKIVRRHQKVKDFDYFFQKFKTLRKFDILTKFEDNWSTRTVVGNFTSNPLPPPPPENDLFFSYFFKNHT